MSVPKEYQQQDPVDVEGIEIFETRNEISTFPVSYQENTRTIPEGLTIKQASKFLKVSPNTIRAQIKAGELAACKIKGKRCEEWRVFPGIAPGDFQQDTSTLPEGFQTTRPSTDKLLELVERQSKELQAASCRIGYLESQLQERTKEVKLLEDRSRVPWYRRFWGWFTGSSVT